MEFAMKKTNLLRSTGMGFFRKRQIMQMDLRSFRNALSQPITLSCTTFKFPTRPVHSGIIRISLSRKVIDYMT